jgi:hypothetical protein
LIAGRGSAIEQPGLRDARHLGEDRSQEFPDARWPSEAKSRVKYPSRRDDDVDLDTQEAWVEQGFAGDGLFALAAGQSPSSRSRSTTSHIQTSSLKLKLNPSTAVRNPTIDRGQKNPHALLASGYPAQSQPKKKPPIQRSLDDDL